MPAFSTSASDYCSARKQVAEATAAHIEAGTEERDKTLCQRMSAVVLAHRHREHLRDRSWFAATGMNPQPDKLPSIADILREPTPIPAREVI